MLDKLQNYLKKMSDDGIALAYSGGVDSSLLLKILADLHRQKDFPLAILTMKTVLQSSEEISEAECFARTLGLNIKILVFNPLSISEVQHNSADRCYFCKKAMFQKFADYAKENNLRYLIDGTNADDGDEYRPGLRALYELGVISPLAELGINKANIRQMSQILGLASATKPSVPCLATRFEYGTCLNEMLIQRVAQGEALIRQMFPNMKNLRLRVHCCGRLARIEVANEYIGEVCSLAQNLVLKLKNLGFEFVTLDLEGFRSGSFDGQKKGK